MKRLSELKNIAERPIAKEQTNKASKRKVDYGIKDI